MLPPNRKFQESITPKSKRMKNGKTHPWKARGPTTAEYKEGISKSEAVVAHHSTMGIKK